MTKTDPREARSSQNLARGLPTARFPGWGGTSIPPVLRPFPPSVTVGNDASRHPIPGGQPTSAPRIDRKPAGRLYSRAARIAPAARRQLSPRIPGSFHQNTHPYGVPTVNDDLHAPLRGRGQSYRNFHQSVRPWGIARLRFSVPVGKLRDAQARFSAIRALAQPARFLPPEVFLPVLSFGFDVFIHHLISFSRDKIIRKPGFAHTR